ncbi:MAG: 1,4-dihydroxy-2-naphthoate octaprenyltransferase [Actinobacteria bacterium]|nr:1,4-dihydroxy-2-naphthoate octaprenyltransferase [Actinomycetota bacterium]
MNPWLAAARPRTLPAALVPVIVAAAAAHRSGVFDWLSFALTLLGAVAIQVAANFANDASDAARGADPEDRLGPPRMVASGRLSAPNVWRACVLAVAVAAACGVVLALRVGPVILLIGLASILAMLSYVGGPFPYGYRGLGEVFVLAFFGVVATAGSRLAYDGQCPAFVWWLGIPIGLLAAGILMANNLRDLPTDKRVGKRTLAVLIGEPSAVRLFFATLWVALALTLLLVTIGVEPPPVAAGAAAGIFIVPLHQFDRTDPRRYVSLLGGTVRVHLAFGLLVALGLLL